MSTSINTQRNLNTTPVVPAPKNEAAQVPQAKSTVRPVGEPSAHRFETHDASAQKLVAPGSKSLSQPSIRRSLGAANAAGTQTTATARPLNRNTSNAPLERTQSPAGTSVDTSAQSQAIANDLQNGNIDGDQAVQRAEEHVAQMRADGASPESIQAFYQDLATQTAGQGHRVNSNGGQCYQNGNVRGSTPGEVFETSASEAFQRRANQAGFEAKMTNALGRPVDPNNLQDVRSYMDHVARDGGLQGVQNELNDYMTNFYTHGHDVGYSNNWTNPPNVNDIQNSALRDGGGRKVIDCDGYAAIAREVTDGIQDGRFRTQYGYVSGGDGAHMLLGVEDTQSGQGFVVDNNETSATYNFAPGSNSSNAFRQGIQQSLNLFHNGQEITSNGTGVGSTIQGALNTMR